MSEPDELPALGRLAFDELAGAVAGIEELHRGIAGRAFRGVARGVGPAARVPAVAHDAIAGAVYAGMRGGVRAAGYGAEALLRRRGPGGRAVSSTPRGAALVAALNGLIGDALERQGSPLHQPMGVRVDEGLVEPSAEALAAAFPAATPRLVVFLHGLMETERSWRFGGGETYGERLARERGCTPVYLRYNTGRQISHNGRSLSALLEQLVAAWPVPVERLSLVGHSMGGLVARSAACCAVEEQAAWVRHVRHVVSLGTPHLGAPLEQGVHLGSAALHALPETRPLARFLRRRSGGIRDLHQGSLVDEDWAGRDPDALRAAAVREVPLLEGATHCFVAATVTRSPRHPVGRLVGDWLVLEPSASGRGRTRRIPFQAEHGMHLGGANHFALLNHPAVYGKLREWLDGD